MGWISRLPLLEVWRTPFVRVRQGALQMRHLCGLDTVKTGISTCGGEYDPLKCMIKGYDPPRKQVPEAYMEKLRNWATSNNVKFGKNRGGPPLDPYRRPERA